MTQTEFVDALSEATGLTKKDSREVMLASVRIISQALINHDEVILLGLGKFYPHYIPERVAKPFGKEMVIPEHYKVKFKPATKLAEAVK